MQQGALDLALLQSWISQLLEERGGDMYRMKGVLHIAHAEQAYLPHISPSLPLSPHISPYLPHIAHMPSSASSSTPST